MSRILVTGASGFVGRRLCRYLLSNGFSVIGATRASTGSLGLPDLDTEVIGDIGGLVDWRPLLKGVDQIVHTAARVHVMDRSDNDALTHYRSVNVEGTRRLAEQAAEVGVRRLIFLSSIKVNGEATSPGHPFTAESRYCPVDPYGRSKSEAEQMLLSFGRENGLEVVVIRPPLVYGPGVGANFRAMVRVLHRGLPLPFAAIKNKRSLVYIDNLVDLILHCIKAENASGKIFLVSDGEDLATPELLRVLSEGLGRSARLFPIPVALLRFIGVMTGKTEAISRLAGSLQVDIRETRETLDWTPPVTASHGLLATAKSFVDEQNGRNSG